MPLKGEAKKLYQREYMRHYRQGQEDWGIGDCEACGRHGIVDKHHRDRNHDNKTSRNIVSLCPNCHAEIHRKGRTIEDLVRPIDADGNVIYE